MQDPRDLTLFSGDARPTLRLAQAELCWLLDRGYPMAASLALVGNRHALEARAREALRRSACTEAERDARAAKRVAWESLRAEAVDVDGFNLVVTLESALAGAVLLVGRDGATRDLAGMRGSFHLSDGTEGALAMVGEAVRASPPSVLRVWLDAPVSNSGRLRARWAEVAGQWPCAVELLLVADADAAMAGCAAAVSSDARVIDDAVRWCDLAGWCVARAGLGGDALRMDGA